MDQLDRDFNLSVRTARCRFLDLIEPLRPELYRYCRSLAGNVWDGEDLLQDLLLKAFAKLADIHRDVANPRAYLFRIATNLWIDRTRKRTEAAPTVEDPPLDGPETAAAAASAPEIREAIGRLAHLLPPRERACILLKDVFDFDLKETAAQLETSVGAVKAALHRGRAKLAEKPGANPPVEGASGPSPQLLDRFVAAFNDRDLQGLAALMLEDATAEVVACVQEYGREQIRDGSLHHTLFDEEGEPKAERVVFRGENLLILWYTHEGKRVVRDVLRLVEAEGGFRRLRYYYFCPETLAEVINEMGLPLGDNGYRY